MSIERTGFTRAARITALGVASALGLALLAPISASAAAPTVVVKGHVTSPTGKPVAGVIAAVISYSKTGYVLENATTSRTGRYEVRIIRADAGTATPYRLVVSDPGDADLDDGDGVWAPTEQDFDVPGTSRTRDAVVHHGAQVSGRIYDDAGRSVGKGLVVHAEGPTQIGEPTTRTDASGAYHFRNLAAGPTKVSAEAPKGTSSARYYSASSSTGVLDVAAASSLPLRFGAKSTGRSIRFPQVGKITGRFTVDGATPTGGTGNAVRTVLYDATGAKVAAVDSIPTFKFRDLPAGTYRLGFESVPGARAVVPEFYVDSATLAGAKPIVVGAGDAVSGLSAALASGPTPTATPKPTATPSAVPTGSPSPSALR